MANLKTLKTRIKSVKSTKQITKAMKMVSASRLNKAKALVESSRPYANKVFEIISNLASNISIKNNPNNDFPLLTGKGKSEIFLLVVMSSDRGLCGGLNSATVKFVKNRINTLVSKGKEVKIFCVGKKAYEQLKIIYRKQIIDTQFGIFKEKIDFETAERIFTKIQSLFHEDSFDVCEVIFSKFKSALAQEQLCQQIIPAQLDDEQKPHSFNSPINYEPGEEEVLSQLLPKNIKIQLYNQLLENSASEHGARMAAMEAATNNAEKMIKGLTLSYNRTRQAFITKELIDIISGANVA